MNETEWSALLFFTAKGHPIDPSTFECTLMDLYLQDIGTHAFTAFKNDANTMMDLYEAHPEYMDYRMGIIHSHHNMDTFFSGTDMSELNDNSNGIDFYLSVVVNNRAEWIARAVYQVEESNPTISWRQDDEKKTLSISSKSITKLRVLDLNVLVSPADPILMNRVAELRKKNASKVISSQTFINRNDSSDYSRKISDVKQISPADESFEKWRKNRQIPNHVSPRQMNAFEDKTIMELFEEEQRGLFNDTELEEQIATMEEIAKACISIHVEEDRPIHKIVEQIKKEITEQEVDIYVDEVIRTSEDIYLHYTDRELTDSSRASLYREIINLADNRNCYALDQLVKELKKEIRSIKGND